MNFIIRSLVLNLSALCICFSSQSSNLCAFIQADKNYLFSGENLQGALHTSRCSSSLTEVTVALVGGKGEIINEEWIRLSSKLEPFAFQVPSNTLSGIYQLIAYSRDGQIVYQSDFPIFDPAAISPEELGSTPFFSDDFPETSSGLKVEWNRGSTEAGAYLELDIKSSAKLPLNLSLKVTDHAQSIPDKPVDYFTGPIEADSSSPPGLSKGFTFEGFLKDSNGNPCAYCPVVLTIPEQVGGIYYTRADEKGKIIFSGLNHYGNKKAYIWTSKYDYGILEFITDDVDSVAVSGVTQTTFEEVEASLRPQLLRKLLSYRLNGNKCSVDQGGIVESPRNYDQVALINQYDTRVIFDDYFLGQDMKETVKSIVPNVNFVRKNQIRIFSYEQSRNFPDLPFILLDGMPISDSSLLNLDPRSVFRIDVVHKSESLQQIGNLAINGVLSVVTKSGTDYTQVPGVKKVYIKGYNNLHRLIKTGSLNCPLSPVIYWDPRLIISSEGIRLKVPLPAYYLEAIVSITGFDANDRFIQYQGKAK